MTKKIILGLHNALQRGQLARSLPRASRMHIGEKYETVSAPTLELTLDAVEKAEDIYAVVMDANLGSPGSEDFQPTKDVYDAMVSKGYEAPKIVATSGIDDFVEASGKLASEGYDGVRLVDKMVIHKLMQKDGELFRG